MYLPNTNLAALVLIVFSIVCWGSWANLLKLGGSWRFEFFYYDFACGAVICAVIAAFTLGTPNSTELTFQDNLLIAGYKNIAYAVGAGMLFNCGNMLLAGAISISGMAVAFPIAAGAMLAIAGAAGCFSNTGSLARLASGAAFALAACILAAAAGRARAQAHAPPRRAGRAITLATFAGILMAGFYPILRSGAWSESGVGPYGTALFVAAGMLLCTLLLNPFFLNFPVLGKPIEVRTYFASKREHILGIFAGVIWMAGAVAHFAVANSAPASGFAATYETAQSAAIIAVLWGLFAWREFRVSGLRAKLLLSLALLCLGVAIAFPGANFGI